MFRWIKIRKYERGLLFRDRVFRRVLHPGRHFVIDPLFRVGVNVVSVRDAWLDHDELDVIVRSGELGNEVRVLDLRDNERALVWIDGRFEGVFGPGLRALWTVFHDVKVEVVDVAERRLDHRELAVILAQPSSSALLASYRIAENHAGVLSVDGRHQGILEPGIHAFWRGTGDIRVDGVDLREQVLDIGGQELMTADKVSLRLNAVVAFRVVDPLRAVNATESFSQALYRDAQLALRAVIGARELDAFLTDREGVAGELERLAAGAASELGLEVVSVGIRDVILPGEMKAILNRVTEAAKAAEADLITRREETAAMRSQANTARIFESNPALMRLRELEVLEKVADKADLHVLLGEKGLADRIMKLV